MTSFDHLRDLDGYKRLTTEGRQYFETVLANPPARPVGENSLFSISGAYSAGRFPYMKQYDSGGCEKPFVLMSILDRTVVDIISQPHALSIVRHNILGRPRPGSYVCDYIRCTQTEFSLVENKPKAAIQKLASRTRDWFQDSGGTWHFGPCDEVASRLGMGSMVFCPDEYPVNYLVNLQFLCRIPFRDLIAEKPKLLPRLQDALSERPHSILESCKRFEGLTGAYIYQALVRGHIYGLLEMQQFDADFVLFRTEAEVNTQKEHLLGMAAPRKDSFGPMHRRLLLCSETELRLTDAAKLRFQARRKAGKKLNATDYRDIAKMRKAELEGAPVEAAFVRRVGERGGKGQPLGEEHRQGVVDHIKLYFKEHRVPTFSKLRGDFEEHAKDKNLYVPSPSTHRKIFNEELAPERAAFLTGGKKAFHAARPMTDGAIANSRLAIAGLHVHIDGVFGDVRSKPDEEAEYLRPIFYPLLDDVTGKVFGCGVKVGRPSMIAVAMAHRDCYLRNGFLPVQIYHDFGSEFYNTFIPEMCGRFEIGYEQRIAGAPRFGGLGESLNAHFSAFLQTLVGGAYFDKAGRSASGKYKSRATAAMDIPRIVRAGLNWLFDTWSNSPIGPEHQSPNERFADLLRCFPEALVSVDDCILARYRTSMPIKSLEFDYKRGYRYGGTRFTSTELADLLRADEKPTGPRLDCMDPSCILAMTRGGPIELRSLDFKRVQGLDLALRLEEQASLLFYGPTAKYNQATRNAREARLRRDTEVAVQGVRSTYGESPEPAPVESAPLVDFSASLARRVKRLNELK